MNTEAEKDKENDYELQREERQREHEQRKAEDSAKRATEQNNLKGMRDLSNVFGRDMTTGEGIMALVEAIADQYKVTKELIEAKMDRMDDGDKVNMAERVYDAREEQEASQDDMMDEIMGEFGFIEAKPMELLTAGAITTSEAIETTLELEMNPQLAMNPQIGMEGEPLVIDIEAIEHTEELGEDLNLKELEHWQMDADNMLQFFSPDEVSPHPNAIDAAEAAYLAGDKEAVRNFLEEEGLSPRHLPELDENVLMYNAIGRELINERPAPDDDEIEFGRKETPDEAKLNEAFRSYREGNKEALSECVDKHFPEKRLNYEVTRAQEMGGDDPKRSEALSQAGVRYLENKGIDDKGVKETVSEGMKTIEKDTDSTEITQALKDSVEMSEKARKALSREDGLNSKELAGVTKELTVGQTLEVSSAQNVDNTNKAKKGVQKVVDGAAKQKFTDKVSQIKNKGKAKKVETPKMKR